jgi:hypothetical protein
MQWGILPAGIVALAVISAYPLELAPELATLARIRVAMAETLARQPDYTCVQQIERSRRMLPRRRFELHDLLRIEVALVEGKEFFAWPGARKFEETDLTEMVTGGAIGTGDFALHARSVFETSAPVFKYAGTATLRGHQARQFDFVVPLAASGYHLKSGGLEAIVGYHGSLWADARDDQLLRLEVQADDIPRSLGIGSVRDIMDYGRVRIGASDFLLPLGSDLEMTDLAGNQSRNRTQFKSCRQYLGESVLTFAGAPMETTAEPPSSPREKTNIEVPGGMALDIRLTTDIDSASSAVGDPVTATLDYPLKQKHQVLFQKGAHLFGRILRFERHPDYATIDLEFFDIESGTSRSTVLARVEEVSLPLPYQPPASLFAQAAPPLPGGGVRIRGSRIHLSNGIRLRLRTFDPRKVRGARPSPAGS